MCVWWIRDEFSEFLSHHVESKSGPFWELKETLTRWDTRSAGVKWDSSQQTRRYGHSMHKGNGKERGKKSRMKEWEKKYCAWIRTETYSEMESGMQETDLRILSTVNVRDFRWVGPVVKSLPCNAGDMGSILDLGTKITHTLEQLSPHATATEPAHCSERSHMMQLRPDAAK